MLRLSLWTIGAGAALGGVGLAGCGFVPFLEPFLGTRSCLMVGFVAGQLLG